VNNLGRKNVAGCPGAEVMGRKTAQYKLGAGHHEEAHGLDFTQGQPKFNAG